MLPPDFSTPLSLSALIITKNEAKNLSACLDSVNWVNEIIVVDAQSTDETVSIARQFTERVFIRPWPGFGRQKNFGVAQARSDWILIVDADERVSTELAQEIQALLEVVDSPRVAAFRIPRRNYFYGEWIRWGGAYPDFQIRLFEKGRAHYNDIEIHENLIVTGEVGTLTGHFVHYTEPRITDHFRKFNTYTTLAASEKGRSQTTVSWCQLVCHPFVVFFKTYFLKKGFRDGTRGIIFAVFASMYTFVKYAKLWEINHCERAGD